MNILNKLSFKGLRGVKRELLQMLTKCSVKSCQDVLNNYEIGKLDANGIHYDQVSIYLLG